LGRINIHDAADIHWMRIGEMASPGSAGVLTQGELASDISYHERGSETDLQLMEVKYVPNAVIDPHSHDEDEIIYVVEGELHLGARVLRPGSSIYIPRATVYSYQAGADGLRVVNFRPRGDFSFNPKVSA
jgi:quercetin dioxygenase-like cupin family protein